MKYRELKGYKYELMQVEVFLTKIMGSEITKRYFVLIPDGELAVRGNYMWDGPSGPTFDTKNFMRGSLVHDCLYQMMREGLLDRKHRKYADQLLRKICLEDGMSKFRAWYIYQAVRIFAKKSSLPSKNPRGKIIEI